MYASTIKLLIYVLLVVVGVAIYQANLSKSGSKHTFQPLFSKLHTSGASINRTIILSHRGSRYIMPENTILAFQTALDIGADVIETDVRRTSDGHLVVFHDKQIVRVTGLPGDIETHTLEQLKSIDVAHEFSPDNGTTYPFRNRGFRIPTAREMFEKLPSDTPLNIEIKEDDLRVSQLLWNEIERAFDNGRPKRSVVISCRFCAPTLHIRELAAEYATKHSLTQLPITTSACERDVVRFLLMAQFFMAKIWYSWFPITQFEVFQIPPISGPLSLDTSRIIEAAHYFGKHIHYWVINSPVEIERMSKLGIEGIITDRPDNAVRVFQSVGLKPKSWSIPRPLPGNHSGTYFVPLEDHEEVHTCVSPLCIILQHIHLIVISLVLTFIMFKVVRSSTKKVNEIKRKYKKN